MKKYFKKYLKEDLDVKKVKELVNITVEAIEEEGIDFGDDVDSFNPAIEARNQLTTTAFENQDTVEDPDNFAKFVEDNYPYYFSKVLNKIKAIWRAELGEDDDDDYYEDDNEVETLDSDDFTHDNFYDYVYAYDYDDINDTPEGFDASARLGPNSFHTTFGDVVFDSLESCKIKKSNKLKYKTLKCKGYVDDDIAVFEYGQYVMFAFAENQGGDDIYDISVFKEAFVPEEFYSF